MINGLDGIGARHSMQQDEMTNDVINVSGIDDTDDGLSCLGGSGGGTDVDGLASSRVRSGTGHGHGAGSDTAVQRTAACGQ